MMSPALRQTFRKLRFQMIADRTRPFVIDASKSEHRASIFAPAEQV
jgi:hypothetical protein